MSECVKVIVRCRPINKSEKLRNCQNIVQVDDTKNVVNLKNPNDKTAASDKQFLYDSVYNDLAPTEAIYNDICYSIVDSVLDGYNGTIFAYGQTGCGKSHTMQGPTGPSPKSNLTNSNTDLSSTQLMQQQQRGIISRTFEHIFEATSIISDIRYLVLISYLEIYNETIRDLLVPQQQQLQLKEVPGDGIIVQNLSQHTVNSIEQCENLLNIGNLNRQTGTTMMNAESSRSHSIFTISLEQISSKPSAGDDVDLNSSVNSNLVMDRKKVVIRKGKLNLVDLAGSERQTKTGATGDRLKEATKINLSLSALGNVISALVDGRTKHIPYRDSKLTRLLQDSLGGNTKTLMIACISPVDYNYDETLSTLRYSSRAKLISNKPHINEDPKDTMLKKYQQEITELKRLLSMNTSNSNDAGIAGDGKKDSNVLNEPESVVVVDNSINSAIQIPQNIPSDAEIVQRIEVIKQALIGGERVNDTKLKQRRNEKKMAAQRRLSALANALSRIEAANDRDFLQGHYTDIQHELNAKTNLLRQQRHKYEREINDLQSEFQMERSDYLETIRRLDKDILFYKDLMNYLIPVLRKSGKYIDVNAIRNNSLWNDDLKRWKLPNDSMLRLRLPPATNPQQLPQLLNDNDTSDDNENNLSDNDVNQRNKKKIDERESTSSTAPGRLERSLSSLISINTNPMLNTSVSSDTDNQDDIAVTYFRRKRAVELLHQSKTFHNWKNLSNIRNNNWKMANGINNSKQLGLNRTWCGIDDPNN